MKSRFTGLPAWWVQRVSAVVVLLFVVFVLITLWLDPRPSYPQWRAWITSPGMTVAVVAFFAALLAHMWVGLRDVLLDYARPAGLRHALLALLAAGLLGTAVWVAWILMRAHG